MTYSIFDFKNNLLQKKLLVLSLKGTILIPGTKISTRLIDPQQISIILNCLKRDRMVAVIQEKSPKQLFGVGCVGRISSFAETIDNHLIISITGICRFKMLEDETIGNNMKEVRVDYKPFISDLNERKEKCNIDRKILTDLLYKYVKKKGISFDIEVLEAVEDDKILGTIMMLLPFDAVEKQAFLEAKDRKEAYDTLMLFLKTETIALA